MEDTKDSSEEQEYYDSLAPKLFWSLELEPNKVVECPRAPSDYIIHCTCASFGINVKSKSRTIVTCKTKTKETITSSVICILRQGSTETFNLNLLFDGTH